eukprot:4526689-Ditylum_brightwellii.AAC.1
MPTYHNSTTYKGRGKHGNLGGKHWWFGPGCIARNKVNYLIWYPVCAGSQWVPTCGRLAAGIQDQSQVAIKCKILCVDTNANTCRFWAK